MNDAELRSLERLCSKDDLSYENTVTLTVLGLKAASALRLAQGIEAERDKLRALLANAIAELCDTGGEYARSVAEDLQRDAELASKGGV